MALMINVAIKPIRALDPINLLRSSLVNPERYLTMAVLVIPSLNISTKAKDAVNRTHLPNSSITKLLAKSANPANAKKAMVRFPARERKLSSRTIFFNKFFKQKILIRKELRKY